MGNSFTVSCDGETSCYLATIYCQKDASCNIQCNKPHACQTSNIYASQSDQLSFECGGEGGCYSSSIFCPIAGPCNIDCLDYDACSAIQTNVPSETYDQLSFNCNGPAFGCGKEDPGYPRIYCIDSGVMSSLIWSSSASNAGCYGRCCPVQTGENTDGTSANPSANLLTDTPTPSTTNEVKKYQPNNIVIIVAALIIIIISLGACFIIRKQSNAIKVLEKKQSISMNFVVNNAGPDIDYPRMDDEGNARETNNRRENEEDADVNKAFL